MILGRVKSVCLSGKVKCEHRSKRTVGMNHVCIWNKNIPGRENRKYKGPVGMCSLSL